MSRANTAAHDAGPSMSTPETLAGVFFEPSATFDALRRRPRFLVAALIVVGLFVAFYFLFTQRLGAERVVRSQVEVQAPDADPAQREQQAQMMLSPVVRAVSVASFPLVFAVMFAGGAGLYLLGVTLVGKSLSYRQALSVWVYSTLAPFVLMTLGNVLVLFVSPPDDTASIGQAANRMNLVHANPGVLVDATARPALATALGAFDLLAFYGLFLAAVGLRRVARLPAGSAWGVVLVIYLIAVLARTGLAAAFNRPF